MAKLAEQTYLWSLNGQKLIDGANIGGYQTLTINNEQSSEFTITVRYDDEFRYELKAGERQTEQVNGKDILVTVQPSGTIQPAQAAAGRFELLA